MALAKKNVAEEAAAEAKAAEVETSAVEEQLLEEEAPAQVQVPATAQANPPAQAKQGGAVISQLADVGFEGLEIDWTSFPTVVLDGQTFGTSDGNSLNTSEITVRLMQSRKRYVLRTEVANDEDAELAYTYDMSELANPESELAQKVRKWAEEDQLSYKVKEYIEVVAMVEDPESELDQQMVLLQIPPTSAGRFAGYTASNQMIKKQLPSEYLTRCSAGDKIMKARKPFHPWAFKYVAG